MRVRGVRLAVVAVLVLLVLAVGWTAWQAWRTAGDLRDAEASAQRWRSALASGDKGEERDALAALQDAAGSARDRTDSVTWGVLVHLPWVGDDATGVRALSRSLDVVATEAGAPITAAAGELDGLVSDGRIDLAAVSDLEEPVAQAHRGLVRADDEVAGLDSSGYVGALRTRFDDYVDLVHGLRSGLASADKAVTLLPRLAGGEGPRDYLLLFQNNAEIRATGGMPGSWALLHADDGKLSMVRQGTASDFPTRTTPVLSLSAEEQQVYGRELGLYFQDPGWTADFPRAAQFWRAHWNLRFPGLPIDGVVALDPVGMSYLLDGTGPVKVGDTTLTRKNAVEELLNRPYVEKGLAAQDAFFAAAAQRVFRAATTSLTSPTDFVEGLNRAANEGRLLISIFDKQTTAELSGTRVEGALSGDDGTIPHVDVGLNDLTGSKMSYYLRYDADVEAMSCRDRVQELTGRVNLGQVISPREAAELPPSVTGGGKFGTEPGSQFVMVRVYGPYHGTIDRVGLNGRDLRDLEVFQLKGRPVVNVAVLLSSRDDVLLTWQGTTGPGQTADGELDTTPSITPGADRWTFESAC